MPPPYRLAPVAYFTQYGLTRGESFRLKNSALAI